MHRFPEIVLLHIVLIGVGYCAPADSRVHAPEAGLIDRWTFDRMVNGKTPDATGRFPGTVGNTGGAVCIRREGNRRFLAIPGTHPKDCVTLGTGAAFDLPRRFTLEAWFRPHPAPDRRYTMIVGKRYNHQFQLTWTSSAGGTIEFYVGGGHLKKNRCWKSRIRTGRWLHVVAVYDAGTATGPNQWLYVNGRLARAVRNPAKLSPDKAPLRIAQNSSMTLDNRIRADWDEIAVYSHAWSAREVAMAYSRKRPKATRIAGESWDLPLGAVELWQAIEAPRSGRATQIDRVAGTIASNRDATQGRRATVSAGTPGLVFRLEGRPPRTARGVWRMRLPTPVDLSAFRYCLVRYRTRGLERAVSPLPVLQFEGETGATVSVTSSHLVLDAQPHTCLATVDFDEPIETVSVELRTRGAVAEVHFEQVQLLRTPQIALPPPARLDAGPELVPIPLLKGAFRSFRRVVETALSGLGKAAHDAPYPIGEKSAQEASPIIPFATRSNGTVLWPGETDDNDRPVKAFGLTVPRSSFFPNARDDILEVPVDRSVAEVFLLLACDLPALEKRYSLPPVPWGITDVEAVDIELVYANGPTEFAFPWSVRERGFRVLGPLGVYAVATDSKRKLERIRLHNRMHGYSVGIAAATVNVGPRRFPELVEDPPPVRVPVPARTTTPTAPRVEVDGGVLTMDNGVCGLTADCRKGFSLRELRNRLAGNARYELAPSSGVEVKAGDRLLTGGDFDVIDLTANGPRARVELASKTVDLPLTLVLELEMGTGPEVRMSIRVRNTGHTTLQADIRFPVLNRLVLGTIADTWIFFPQYRNVLTRDVCACRQPNHRGFVLQFMDAFNPVQGGGVGLLTRNSEAEPVVYCLAKRPDGVTAAIESRGEDFPLAPGTEGRLCDRVLAIHGGDWHEAARLYRDWTHTELRPVGAWDKPWFRRAVWIRSHIASPRNAKNIGHTPPLYDPVTHQWRTDSFLEADRRLLGLRPDIFHFYVWAFDDTLSGDVARDGEYGPTDYRNLGGLESFRTAIEHIHKDRKLPVSLYTIWDRFNRDTEFFRTWGDRFAKMRSNGEREVASTKVYISQGVPEWRGHAAKTLERLEKDTGADVIYLDVFGTDDRARDYNPKAGHAHIPAWVAREDADFLEAIRRVVPKRMALWGEFPTTDVGNRYWDGCLMYDCIPLHEYLARTEDRLDTAPGWSRDTFPPNVLRFVWPHLRQVVFPVGTEGTVDNWRFLKFLLFNGQALFDTTWRLYDARCRKRLGRALRIQREYFDCFDTDAPEMFVPTRRGLVFANRFPGKNRTVWTLFNGRYRTVSGPLIEVPHVPGAAYRDLWNDQPLQPRIDSGRAVIELVLPPQGIGCVVQILPKSLG